MQDPMPPNIKYEATIRFLSTGLIMLNYNIDFGYIKAQSVNLYQRFVRQFTRDKVYLFKGNFVYLHQKSLQYCIQYFN